MWHVDARRRTRQIRDRSVFGQRASRQLGFCRLACPKPLRSRAPICRVELFWTTGFSPTGVLSGHLSENATVADYGLSAGLPTWVFNMSCQLGLSIWAAGPQAWLSVRAASLGCQPGLPTGVPPDPGRRTPCARPPQTKDRIPRCPNRQADSCPVRVGQPFPCVKVWDDRARRALMFLAGMLRHAHQASICSPRSTLAQRVAGDSAYSVNANNLS